jgi:opine dehydrogenase
MKKLQFAIIGAGNGGQSFTGHLGLLGFPVRLWDVDPQRVVDLKKTNRMVVSGAVTGECDIPLVTGNIGEAVEGADIIMMVIPTVFQRSTIKAMAPYLKDGQALVLNPGATGGALEARATLQEEGCLAKVLVAETDTLLYACRSPKPGEAIIGGIKDGLSIAALPATDTARVAELLNQAFPQFKAVSSVLITSLNNANAMMHPSPTILNAGRIECAASFDYYFEGVTPSLARVVETVDAERLAIGKAMGVEVPSIHDFYRTSYAAFGKNLHEQLQNVKAYVGIKGPTSLNTRYIFEDLPTGLVPLSALGAAVGVPTPTMNSIVQLGNILLERDFWVEGRSLEKLGLAGLTPDEVRAKVL